MNTLILIPGHNEKERGHYANYDEKIIDEYSYTLTLSKFIEQEFEFDRKITAEIFTRIYFNSYRKECIDVTDRINSHLESVNSKNNLSLELHFNDLGNPNFKGVESFIFNLPIKSLSKKFKNLYHSLNQDLAKLLNTRNRCFSGEYPFFKKKSKEERGSGILSRLNGDRMLVELFAGNNKEDTKTAIEKQKEIAKLIAEKVKTYFDMD
jgi:N-acetylmuramoyl-L-alanine amidase